MLEFDASISSREAPLCCEELATPGEQATDVHRILRNFVATHRSIAFFNPPANRALTGIVGAIERFLFGSFPRAIARQAIPRVPRYLELRLRWKHVEKRTCA
jgi:hypothetical protein